jgi:hypothetical protein
MKQTKARSVQTAYTEQPVKSRRWLSSLSWKASPRLIVGVGIMCLSYVTCWPLIAFLGWLAVQLRDNRIFSIGSPAAYALSHLLFLVGSCVAGTEAVTRVNKFIHRLKGRLPKNASHTLPPSPSVSEVAVAGIDPDNHE